ncbi:hypothetical protein F7725_024635 [Dissostichus mawsoni]|uniref:Ig-like domain-containing protein n=1 Tax=Dissostichus mawsoni TaxID=36200 RepID=A0A7J5X948_DISMA|nr:hypothetical protein F7725_024635 [Dissostichus mawsoni]
MLLFLLLLGIVGPHCTSARTHSMKYFLTASSGVPNLPEFVMMLLVDEVQITHYDSNTKRAEPKQDWMKRITAEDPQYWETQSQFFLGTQQGYTAVFTKQRWDKDKPLMAYNKYYYTQYCPEYLKKYVNLGRSSLMRTEIPSVSLLQKSPSSPVSCHATGFYPDRAIMFWTEDGEELHDNVDHGEILPNHDGSFQMSVDLNVSSFPAEHWDKYRCVFQLSGVKEDQVIRLDSAVIRTNRGNPLLLFIIGAVVAALALLLAGIGFLVYRKRNANESTPSPASSSELTERLNQPSEGERDIKSLCIVNPFLSVFHFPIKPISQMSVFLSFHQHMYWFLLPSQTLEESGFDKMTFRPLQKNIRNNQIETEAERKI